jgi:hypothetical protein
MTSLRQIISNRQNAFKSCGPRTEEGKKRSSQNALRHGLTAETVVEPIEDPDDYKAFEASITAEYDAETVIERELVLRLVSLLWRLRRAGAIETGLMQLQGEMDQSPSPIELSTDTGASCEKAHQSILEIARCFSRLPADSFALLGRYEASLWHQVRQTIFTLERKQWRQTRRSWRPIESWHRET